MTQTQTPPDTRPLLVQSLDQVTPLIAAVTLADLDRPTPCEEWSVRDLLSHLVAVETRIVHIAGGGHFAEVPAQVSGIADDGWSDAWASGLATLTDALADDNLRGTIWQHPAGAMPGFQALAIYASEFAVHAWDLARALGRDADLDQSLAAAVVGPITAALPAEPRGIEPIPFGPVVDVPADAAPYPRLVGWVGRDPNWVAA